MRVRVGQSVSSVDAMTWGETRFMVPRGLQPKDGRRRSGLSPISTLWLILWSEATILQGHVTVLFIF